jgi:hypothetical protein
MLMQTSPSIHAEARARGLRKMFLPENYLLLAFLVGGSLQSWFGALWHIGPSSRVMVVDQILISVLLAYWVMLDSARRGIPRPFIHGYLLLGFGLVLIPWHIFKTRGWRGFLTLGIFFVLYFLAFALPYVICG